jgi:hypothetical protein
MPWSLTDEPKNVVQILNSFEPGFRLVDGGDLKTMAELLFSVRDNIYGGTGLDDATPIQTYISQVVSGDSVVLPPGLPGRYVWVFNDTAADLQVYAASPNPLTGIVDEIDGQIMFAQSPGSALEYVCYAPGLWKVFGDGADGGSGPGPSPGIPDAPINGVTYGRLNGAWVPVLNLAGGTMTGPLILAPGTPTDPNQAISLSYIQNLHIDEGTY